MNNHNLIKKIIEYIPRKIYIVSFYEDCYGWHCLTIYDMLSLCATIDKAIEEITTYFLTRIVFEDNFAESFYRTYGNKKHIPKKFYRVISGKKSNDDGEIENFLYNLNETMRNECKNKDHDKKHHDGYFDIPDYCFVDCCNPCCGFFCESCKKTETYLRIYSIIKNFITKKINEKNYFHWKEKSVFSVRFYINPYVLEQ